MKHRIRSWAGAMLALESPFLRQALYDAGGRVMADALITLQGDAHRRRRIVEMSVFGRGFFRTYARERFAAVLTSLLTPCVHAGRAEVIELGYRLSMNLTADFAGIDRGVGSTEETESLLTLVKTFSEGATLVHSTRDHDEVNEEVDAAMQVFDQVFFQPSLQRREALVTAVQAGSMAADDLPRDVLTTLIRARDRLPLSTEVLRREMSFFLQAGAHSTTNSVAHALHEIFVWAQQDPSRQSRLSDQAFVQRCVHESLRLHPASPVAVRQAMQDCRLGDLDVAAGEMVEIDLAAANRDVVVFGADADTFNPERVLPPNVWPWGLSFGYGTHACLGRDLDGGVIMQGSETDPHPGIVPMLVHALLAAGARPVVEDPPQLDTRTIRQHWYRYPIQFSRDGA
jgi:cytochrome P450